MNNNNNINNIVGDYKFGFKTDVENVFDTGYGINEDVVRTISKIKKEPDWMLEQRLNAIITLKKRNGLHLDRIYQH